MATEFASMKEKRGYAAGVMHKNKFHVFGGYDGSSIKDNWAHFINVMYSVCHKVVSTKLKTTLVYQENT